MRIKELIYNGKVITSEFKINSILEKENFHWLIDAEIEEAKIEIQKNTIIWHSGIWYSGTWEYGIWLDGTFKSGKWVNGVMINGSFHGKFESGIIKGGNLKK